MENPSWAWITGCFMEAVVWSSCFPFRRRLKIPSREFIVAIVLQDQSGRLETMLFSRSFGAMHRSYIGTSSAPICRYCSGFDRLRMIKKAIWTWLKEAGCTSRNLGWESNVMQWLGCTSVIDERGVTVRLSILEFMCVYYHLCLPTSGNSLSIKEKDQTCVFCFPSLSFGHCVVHNVFIPPTKANYVPWLEETLPKMLFN